MATANAEYGEIINIPISITENGKEKQVEIEDEDGYDYFLNISNLRKGIKIREGSKVKFDVFQGQKGDEAENVSLV